MKEGKDILMARGRAGRWRWGTEGSHVNESDKGCQISRSATSESDTTDAHLDSDGTCNWKLHEGPTYDSFCVLVIF